MSLTIYFLRHGQTTLSRNNVFCGSASDPDLTDEGREMARMFADAHTSLPWQAVYASPLRRTIATAKPLCDALNLQMELRDGLKEIGYGDWEGKSVANVSAAFHDDYLRWTADPAWNAPSGANGEAANAVAQRGLQVVEEIKEKFDNGNVLIVAHKATIRVVLCALLGIDIGRFRFRLGCPVGSVSRVEFTMHGPLLHLLAGRSHLSEHLRSLPGT